MKRFEKRTPAKTNDSKSADNSKAIIPSHSTILSSKTSSSANFGITGLIKDTIPRPISSIRTQIKTSISISPYPLKTDLDLSTYVASELPNPEYEPPLRKLTAIKLTWLTAEEAENMATVVVNNSKQIGPGSIYDKSFGAIENYEKCPICSQGWRECPGHTGVIKLPYSIPHPMCLKRISEILTCFCNHCHRLVLTWKQMRTMGLLMYHKENRFRALLDIAKTRIKCEHCHRPHGKCMVIEDKFWAVYKKKTDVKFPLTYEEVVTILLNIREQEVKLLGFKDPLCHPKHMIITNLCVLPSNCRSFVKGRAGIMHDDLTHKYIDIQRVVSKLEDSAIKEKTKLDLIDDLFFHIKTLLDNSQGRSRDMHCRRNLRAIKQRISGKLGLVHNNIQAKRTVEALRSVVSPNPDLDVREVEAPAELLNKMRFPEIVTSHNIDYCQRLLDEGKVLKIHTGSITTDAGWACWTKGFKLLHGDIVYRNGKKIVPDILVNGADFQVQIGDSVLRTEHIEQSDGTVIHKKKFFKSGIEPPKRKQYKLKVGQVIERKIRNGDWTIANRQPSLHEPSLRAKIIRKHNGNTVRVSLACTQGFGMDFDGDEGSIFNACSQNSRADMMELMSTQAQFINGADSRPTLIMKQDNTAGGYLYTRGRVPVSKATFMDLCCLLQHSRYQKITDQIDAVEEAKEYIQAHETELKTLRKERVELDSNMMKYIASKIEHIRTVHHWVGLHKEEVNRLLILKPELEQKLKDVIPNLRALKLEYEHKRINKSVTRNEIRRIRQLYDTVKSEAKTLQRRIEILEDEKKLDDVASENLLYTGHSLLSMIIPNDFDHTFETKLSPDKKPLQIRRGVILSGTFNNDAIQHLMHMLYKDYGPEFGCDFATYWQRFTNLLLLRQGFSVGLGDCTPKDTELIDTELEKAFLRAEMVEESPLDSETKELKILSILNQATNIGEQIIRRGLDPNNNFMHMIVSGAKGKMFNYVQSVSAVGQQNISGKRVPTDCGGRSLPCYPRAEDVVNEKECKLNDFERHCRKYQSRGFITSSFYDGLESRELFPLAMGGREGLIDTSIKTARCGYLSKRLLKSMEDVKTAYNKFVTNAKGNIVQFSYGYDNYAAPELIRTKNYGLQPMDIEHLVERMNSDIEFSLERDCL